MKKMSKREKIITIITVIVVVGSLLYRFGGDAFSGSFMTTGSELDRLEKLFISNKKSLKKKKIIEKKYIDVVGRYASQGTSNLTREEDIFSEEVARICREMDNPYPEVSKTAEEPLQGVDNYKELLLTVSIDNTYENIMQLLKRFNHSSFLIKELKIKCPLNKTVLDFDITLSKIVKADPDNDKKKRSIKRSKK